jgi:hypothetical protein
VPATLVARAIVAGWRLLEAAEEEGRAARAVVKAANEAAPDDDARDAVAHRARYEIPTAVDAIGATGHVPRRAAALFEGERGDAFDPRSTRFGEALGHLIALGRERGRRELGRVPLETIDRELARGE